MDGYGIWVAPFSKRGVEPDVYVEGYMENQSSF